MLDGTTFLLSKKRCEFDSHFRLGAGKTSHHICRDPISKKRYIMVTYLDVYNVARRKLSPVDSLYHTIGDAKTNHPSLKQFIGHNNDVLIGSINRSARVLLHCIRDIEDFTLSGIRETTVTFVREQFCRAYSHLAHYLGMDVVSKFVSEVTDTPLIELMYGR